MLTRTLRVSLAAVLVLLAAGTAALAQKSGGTLRSYLSANPSSLSIHEEATITTVMPASPVFNTLVQFDPLKPLNSPETIIPDLAESWAWDATGTRLTFKLRQGVTWHDGKPFTAKDVVCTWNRVSTKEADYFRKSPRKIWFENLQEIVSPSDHEVTFVLDRPKPSLLSMLASGYSPVYPCHVSAKDMRTSPVGTGPFKFVEFKSNEVVKLVRNPAYWRKDRPFVDAVEFHIVANRSTRILGLIAGNYDLTSTGDITVPLLGDIAARAPHIACKLGPTNVSVNVLVNQARPPFDNAVLRKALSLGLDRQSFITILANGKSDLAGGMMPRPEGVWGMPTEMLMSLPGYSGTFEERLAEARKLMEGLGHGPAKKLKVKVSTRDFQAYKDPAVLLVDQLNKMHFEAELEIIESTVWFGRAQRQDYAVALNLSGSGVDDPDVTLVENFACKSDNNFTKYCNAEVDKLLAEQSQERDLEKRRKLVWQVEKLLAEDVARPIIYHGRAAQCWHPAVKNYVRQDNSIYNNWRLEDVWLDR
jgi:peptide/nickel transport system substrate-binding protein